MLLTVGCTSYPDDFGFCADLSEPQMSGMTLKPTGYDVTMKTPIAKYDEGTGITRVGYLVNGEERPCELTYSETDGGYCLTITLQDLQFGLTYAIQPFIGDGIYQNNGKTLYVNHQKSTYEPVFEKSEWWMNANGEVIWKAYYTCAAPGYRPVESVTATFSGKAIEATISDDGKEVSVNVGNACKLDVGDYADAKFTVTNAFGSNGSIGYYNATVNEIDGSFPDDGNKEDCIRVCGIDWAKGLFYYDQTTKTYKIEENQWSYPDDLNNPLYGGKGYFHITNNQSAVEKGTCYELKGNKQYDKVAQNMDIWASPSFNDFKLLIDNTSVQPCNIIDESGKSIPGYLFLFPSDTGKRFVSKSSFINVSYKDVDNLGLFLPCLGYFYFYGYGSKYNAYGRTNELYYLTSTANLQYLANNPNYDSIISCYVLRGYSNYEELKLLLYNRENNNKYLFNIRPVKL